MKARAAVKIRPTGVIPPMTTPFTQSGEIDLKHVAPQVDWLIGAGSHGMAAGGSTGEGHTLDHEEYRDLIAATVEAARGRAPVIAGIIVDSTRDAIAAAHCGRCRRRRAHKPPTPAPARSRKRMSPSTARSAKTVLR